MADKLLQCICGNPPTKLLLVLRKEESTLYFMVDSVLKRLSGHKVSMRFQFYMACFFD